MWRDISKSAFVFGIGTFAIISSSYTKELNIRFNLDLINYFLIRRWKTDTEFSSASSLCYPTWDLCTLLQISSLESLLAGNYWFIQILSITILIGKKLNAFLLKCGRGSVENETANQDCVIGEEEAIWVTKMLLPFINEFLLNLRALFSGDPSTTMKVIKLHLHIQKYSVWYTFNTM